MQSRLFLLTLLFLIVGCSETGDQLKELVAVDHGLIDCDCSVNTSLCKPDMTCVWDQAECSTDNDCPSEFRCIDSLCVCREYDFGHYAGMDHQDRYCSAVCSASDDSCPTGTQCVLVDDRDRDYYSAIDVTGRCLFTSCQSNSDCDSGLLCLSLDDERAPTGFADNYCVDEATFEPGTTVNGQCNFDSDCSSLICDGIGCREECFRNADCGDDVRRSCSGQASAGRYCIQKTRAEDCVDGAEVDGMCIDSL